MNRVSFSYVKEMHPALERSLGLLRSFLYFSVIYLLVTGFLPAIFVEAAEQKNAESSKPPLPPSPPPAPATIPLADIATRATEVSNLLGNLTATAPNAQIESIAKTLPELSEKLDAQFLATTKMLEAAPTLETLQNEQQQWQSAQLQSTGWLNALTLQATKLQDSLNQLAELEKLWNSSRTSAQAANAPGPILQQIDATLTAITAAQAPLQAQRAGILNLQSRVAQEVTRCGTALQRIADFQQKAVTGIFVPDASPIWMINLWSDALAALPGQARKIAGAYWTEGAKYLRQPRDGGAIHAALFIVLALIFGAARRKIYTWANSDEVGSSAITVFKRPYAAAAVTTLLVATSPFFQMSASLRELLIVVALVPMIRFVRPMVHPLVAAGIYALTLLFTVDSFRQALGGVQVVGQAILVVETLAAIAAILWLRQRRWKAAASPAESSRFIAVSLIGYFLSFVLIIALLAGVSGYIRLARLLTPGILAGGVLGLGMFAYLRVGGGIVALVLRVWPLRLLKMVQHHRDLLEKRVYYWLAWATVLGWLFRYLNYLGLLDPLWSLGQSLLAAKLDRGTISISVGSIFEFLLTVWIAYLLSAFIRFTLQEDVYPRINIAPGLSYAASSLLNYVILALGFVAGLGVLGVDFSKVSVLAGAFGVGIGFGLQSVVNNFVSGLILLFERPIHVGDTVEVGSVQAVVRRIGIRASILHTRQGADIIVPNSQLVTEKVTNWTLSDRLRRIDLPVGVNYGARPPRVTELLIAVAAAHAQVLKDPPPRAYFLRYGDSSIDFELRVWTDQSHSPTQIKSDLASAVYDAVIAAGLSFPFPQREVRLLRDSASDSNEDIVKGTDKSSPRSEKQKST